MTRAAHRPLLLSALALALWLALPGQASASPFFFGRFGGAAAGPTNRGPFAAYWNPAWVARPGGRLGVHVLGIARQATYDRPAAANDVPPEDAAANAGSATTSSAGAVPALAGGWGMALGPFDVAAGAGFYVAHFGSSAWDKVPGAPAEHPGAVDGPQRWAAIDTSLRVLSFGLAGGGRHRPSGLSLGVAPLFSMAELSTLRARAMDMDQTLNDADGALAEGRVLLEDASDEQLLWVLGLGWELSSDLHLGLAWHQGTVYDLQGRAHVTLGLAPQTEAAAGLPLQVADVVRLGAAMKAAPWLTVRPWLQWAGWSAMDSQPITNLDEDELLFVQERDFADTWAGNLWVDLHVVEGASLHLGGGYETAATPEHTHEPGLAENASWQAGLGASVELTSNLRLSTTYSLHHYLIREVDESVQRPLTNGRYTDDRQYLTVDVELSL